MKGDDGPFRDERPGEEVCTAGKWGPQDVWGAREDLIR